MFVRHSNPSRTLQAIALGVLALWVVASPSDSPSDVRGAESDPGLAGVADAVSQTALVIQTQLGGSTDAVVSVGTRAFAGVGTRVLVLDAAGPFQPSIIGQTTSLPGPVMDLAVAGNTLYVALGGGGVAVVDVADLTKPTVVSTWQPAGGGVASRVVLAGARLFVVLGGPGVRIVDVADRTAPREIGAFGTLVTAVAVKDNIAYTVSTRLNTWDISNPATPIKRLELDTWADAVRVEGNILYAGVSSDSGTGQRTGRLRTFDITNAARPAAIGEAALAGQARGIVLAGGRALVLAGSRLQTFDVSNPGRPRESGSVTVLDGTFGVAPIQGEVVYLAAGGQGLRALDRAHAGSGGGQRVLNVPGRPEALALDGDRLYVDDADERVLIYKSSALDAGPIGSFGAAVLAGAMTAVDGFVYTASADKKLHIFDARNPGAVREVASRSFEDQAQVQRIAVRGAYAYLAADPYLRVWDVGNPANPHQVFMFAPNGGATDLTIGNGMLYITGPSTGLQRNRPSFKTVDLFDPAHPREVGNISAISFGSGIASADSYVFIDALQVVDACTTAAPVEIGRLETPGRTKDIALDGGLLFVAKRSGEGGELRLIDVRLPASPRELAVIPVAASVDDIVAQGGRFWAAAREAGMLAGTGMGPALILPTETPLPTPAVIPTRMPGLSVGAYLPITWKPSLGRACR